MSSLYTYHRIRIHLVRVDDQIKSADRTSWLPPVTKVDSWARPGWTSLWWTTRPTQGMTSPPDLTRPDGQFLRVRRPRPNHEVSARQVADEFTRHGCRIADFEPGSPTRPSGFRAVRRERSALLRFFHDETVGSDVFMGAYTGSQWVRSLDVVRRHLGVPTHH